MAPDLLLVVENPRKARFYLRALRALGIGEEEPRVLLPTAPPVDPTALGATAGGVILCGGPDVNPWRYGEEPIHEAGLALQPDLDELEWAVLDGAREARTPVWAICRGLQMVNVYLGGNLWQDIQLQIPGTADHRPGGPLDELAHGLDRVDTGSAFGRRLAGEGVRVNSRHHQAIRRLAPGLTPVAWSPDGILEVIEDRSGDWWLRGVQWHPEDLVHLPLQRRLWLDFLEAVGQRAGRRLAAAVGEP